MRDAPASTPVRLAASHLALPASGSLRLVSPATRSHRRDCRWAGRRHQQRGADQLQALGHAGPRGDLREPGT